MDLLRHLRHFVVVAEELHFGKAATRLGMAQPPLSQSIQRLEREFGVRLFDRDSRRVTITPVGRALLPGSVALLSEAELLLDSARAARHGPAGGLRVALPAGLEPGRVAALMGAFATAEPDVPLDVSEATAAAQRAALRAGHLDVAVLPYASDDPGFISGVPAHEPLGVLVSSAGPLARLASVHLADLGESPLVVLEEPDGPTDRRTQETCARAGYRPVRVLHVGGQGVALAVVMAGRAIALAPRSSLPGSAGLTWLPLLGSPLWRELVPVWRSALDPALGEAFGECLRQAFGSVPGGRSVEDGIGRRPSSGGLL